jgi:hypothetical protein
MAQPKLLLSSTTGTSAEKGTAFSALLGHWGNSKKKADVKVTVPQ